MIIVWEVTHRCNLDCVFCYNVWKNLPPSRAADMPAGSMMQVADAIADAGPLSVTLTGGEPLLRDDLEEIASRLSGRGVMVGVATNGTLLDSDRAGSLRDSGVSWFELPVHGTRSGTVRDLTGRDCLDSVKRAMQEVRKAGAKLTASHVITSLNCGETGSSVRLAFALGAEAMALNRFVPGGAGLDRLDLLLGRPELALALQQASESASRCPGMTVYAAVPVEPCLYPHESYPYIRSGPCVCGESKWAVSPYGELRICEQSPAVLGSLLEKPLPELARSPEVAVFRSSQRYESCSSCGSARSCGGGCRYLAGYL